MALIVNINRIKEGRVEVGIHRIYGVMKRTVAGKWDSDVGFSFCCAAQNLSPAYLSYLHAI